MNLNGHLGVEKKNSREFVQQQRLVALHTEHERTERFGLVYHLAG
jgi:hypothetical protein